MTDYLITCVIGPCALLAQYCCQSRYKDLARARESLLTGIFRFHSSISYSLIKSYKLLGHMVPIPRNMYEWSPKLYSMLCQDFYKVAYFKKGTSNNYTCTNIPVLVAILVFLESKDLISFRDCVVNMNGKHHSKGSLKWTNRWKKDNFEANEDGQAWVTLLPFSVSTGVHITEDFQLHEAICLLLTGGAFRSLDSSTQEPTLGSIQNFQIKVNEAIQDLSYTTIIHLIREGKLPTETVMPGQKDLDPYLSQPEVKLIQNETTVKGKLQVLEDIKRNFISKAFNMQMSITMLKGGNEEFEDEAEYEEDTKPPAVVGGKRKAVVQEELQYLIKPKKKKQKTGEAAHLNGIVPTFYENYAQKFSLAMKKVVQKSGINFNQAPESVWAHLHQLGDTNEVSDAGGKSIEDYLFGGDKASGNDRVEQNHLGPVPRRPLPIDQATTATPVTTALAMPPSSQSSSEDEGHADPKTPPPPARLAKPETPTQKKKRLAAEKRALNAKAAEQATTATSVTTALAMPPLSPSSSEEEGHADPKTPPPPAQLAKPETPTQKKKRLAAEKRALKAKAPEQATTATPVATAPVIPPLSPTPAQVAKPETPTQKKKRLAAERKAAKAKDVIPPLSPTSNEKGDHAEPGTPPPPAELEKAETPGEKRKRVAAEKKAATAEKKAQAYEKKKQSISMLNK
jgi:hypothetical protein